MEHSKDICDVQDVRLISTNKDGHCIFNIQFDINNPNYDLHKALGFKLYSLIGELNKDIIDQHFIDNYDDNSVFITNGIVFKQFGKEVGLSQKYVFSKIQKIENGNIVKFIATQIQPSSKIILPIDSESVFNSSSTLNITLLTSHSATINYDFSMEIDEDMPSYMENIPGLLMKKMFSRLKKFLESII